MLRQGSTQLLALIAIACLTSTSPVHAAETSSELNPRDVINDYRLLRSTCAQTQGEERRECYARLNQQTEQYQHAKDRIKSAQMLGLRLTAR